MRKMKIGKIRKHTKLGLLIVVILATAVLSFICGFMFSIDKKDDGDEMYLSLQFGDMFPFDAIKTDNDNKISMTNEYSIIFYTSPYCSACAEEISSIQQMMNVLNNNSMDLLLLWDEEPMVANYQVSHTPTVWLKDGISIYGSFPQYYILKNNQVYFRSDDLSLLIEKAFSLELLDVEKCQENFLNGLSAKLGCDVNEIALYFKVKDGSESEGMDEFIDSDDFQLKYNVSTIYSDASNASGQIIDEYGLYRKVFGIDEYPCIAIIGNDNHIVKITKDQIEEYSSHI